MSTRATYQFICVGDIKSHDVTFYIHHDGYLEGAARYFQNALTYNGEAAPNAQLSDEFYRANERAELTEGHDVHGDTAFQYTVVYDQYYPRGKDTKAKLVVHHRGECVWNGSLTQFIKEYGG